MGLKTGDKSRDLRKKRRKLARRVEMRALRKEGAAKAAERGADRAKAEGYYEKLIALAAHADGARPDLVAAKQYLAGN